MQFWSLLINPLTVAYLIVLSLTWWSFSELSILSVLSRALTATMDAVTFAIVDSIVSTSPKTCSLCFIFTDNDFVSSLQIYGNWLYPVITTVFFPIWIMFFNVLCIPSQPDQDEISEGDNINEMMQRKKIDFDKFEENDMKKCN